MSETTIRFRSTAEMAADLVAALTELELFQTIQVFSGTNYDGLAKQIEAISASPAAIIVVAGEDLADYGNSHRVTWLIFLRSVWTGGLPIRPGVDDIRSLAEQVRDAFSAPGNAQAQIHTIGGVQWWPEEIAAVNTKNASYNVARLLLQAWDIRLARDTDGDPV